MQSYLNKLTFDILGVCIEVHRGLGAGLLESVYHKYCRPWLRITTNAAKHVKRKLKD